MNTTIIQMPMMLKESVAEGAPIVDEPKRVYEELKAFSQAAQEHFIVLTLNRKNGVIGTHVVTVGLVDSCLVHPREVFRQAILDNASGVILAHNHPSGNPEPSPEDIRITRELIKAGKILDINVLDHVVIGDETYKDQGVDAFFSIRESGLVQFEG